jgi:hypothetical protein
MVFLCITVKTPTPLAKHTRPLLTTGALVMKCLKVTSVLYEQFNELSSSLHSRYGYGTGCILSGFKVKCVGKKKTIPSQPTVNRFMSGLQQKYWVFHEITVGATCTKRTICKEQATELFKEASALTQMQQSSTSKNEFLKDMCNWMVSVYIRWFKLQVPEFRSFWKSTASNIFQTSQHFENIICLPATKKPWKT